MSSRRGHREGQMQDQCVVEMHTEYRVILLFAFAWIDKSLLYFTTKHLLSHRKTANTLKSDLDNMKQYNMSYKEELRRKLLMSDLHKSDCAITASRTAKVHSNTIIRSHKKKLGTREFDTTE
ncbi:hypothetical protein V6N13_067244 [Hibiscus sabdariffa]|uniref:Uncharacterized protein n=1 Tax=Hibiscus sabdariffa TaxID=183260 RepID=A0ABR2DT85_9ROSI